MTLSLLTRLRAGPDADLSHLPVSLDLRAVNFAEGVRAALAVASIVAINEWAHIPALGETALGALLTCLCDPGGPIRRRLPPLLIFAGIGATITCTGSMLRELDLVTVALVAAALIFCNSLARIWGQSALQVGNVLTVVTVLALDRPEPPRTALLLGAMFLAGSLWAVALALGVWRLYPYRPARKAVSEVYRRLTTLTADLAEQVAPETAPDWAAHARAHRRYVRDGIETARGVVFGSIRGRGQASPRGSALLIQIETADQVFGALIALSDVLETVGPPAWEAARPLLPALRLLLAAIADGVLDERGNEDQARRGVLEHLIAQLERGRDDAALAGIIGAIVQRVKIAALMTTPEGQLAESLAASAAGASGRLGLLRANLTWDSAAFRHALRAAVVAIPALLITLASGQAYAHWLTITLVLTLQPFFALTWQRALERIVGTIVGGVIAAAIAALISTPVAIAAVLFPLSIIAFSVRYVGFGLFMAAITPMVVLLSELGQPGLSEFVIAAERAGYTALGGIMALAGGALLWPSWEPDRLRQELRRAIEAHGAFADLALAARLGEPAAGLDAARRAAGLATNNLEASLARSMQEPLRQGRADLRSALVADAALRRMAGRLAALQYEPEIGDAALLRRWRTWFAAAFAALECGERLPGPPPESAEGSLVRIARQILLMAGAQRPEGAALPEAPIRQAPP